MINITTGSAITVLNAIGSGIGSTLGIEANISIQVENAEHDTIRVYPIEAGKKLVKTSLQYFRRKYLVDEPLSISTKSELPPERGLKTSSAISTILMKAFSDYYKINLNIHEIIKLGAFASLDAGVSITGALDDAYGAYFGGYHVTNNVEQRIMLSSKIPKALHNSEVLLLIPESKNQKGNFHKLGDKLDVNDLNIAKSLALNSEIIEAIALNTKIYKPFLLEDQNILTKLQKDTSSIVGINGAGPSLFIIHDKNRVDELKEIIKNKYHNYNVVATRFQKLKQ